MSTMNEFLKAINGPYENAIGDFARRFDEEKFELILKLINNEQMTESEMTMALNKYRFDIDMQGVLVSVPQIPSEIKKQSRSWLQFIPTMTRPCFTDMKVRSSTMSFQAK